MQRTIGIAIAAMMAGSAGQTAMAQDAGGHPYIGIGASSLALDADRVPGVPTRSPGHSSKVVSLYLGYRFDDNWAADVGFGTDVSNNVDVDEFALNGYRYLGDSGDRWRPYLSAGLSNFQFDSAVADDDTDQFQFGFGVAGDLTDAAELRVGYQRYATISGDSYDDDAVSVRLNWQFGKPAAVVAAAEPVPQAAPAPVPAPTPEPVEKEVADTYELLVEFDFDKSNIRSYYEPQFREIADKLNADAEMTMTIEGHTDWIGTDEYNQALSIRRAEAVKRKFVEDYGFAADRIDIEGYGESRPKATNETAEGRQRNRRAVAVMLRVRTVKE